MKRTTIALPDELAAAVAREARRRDQSVSALAREALSRHLGLEEDAPRAIPFGALGRSGEATTARDMEQLLEREWDDAAGGR